MTTLGIHDFWAFLATGVLLNLVPGQDSMFILGRSLSGGLRSGVAAALGISVGSLIHTSAAALGLSAILAASTTAFTAVKWVGAAYLVFLGVRLLLATPASSIGEGAAEMPACGAWASLRQGILTNLLNPKVALFFLALLPQFIDPLSTHRTLAFMVLGATFVTTGTIWCLTLAVAAARLRVLLTRKPQLRTLINRAAGVLFVALGARLAWSRA
jgi:threonine/homoserine/homoserine lactone efflux protein